MCPGQDVEGVALYEKGQFRPCRCDLVAPGGAVGRTRPASRAESVPSPPANGVALSAANVTSSIAAAPGSEALVEMWTTALVRASPSVRPTSPQCPLHWLQPAGPPIRFLDRANVDGGCRFEVDPAALSPSVQSASVNS